MRGLRTQEDLAFKKFFEIVQKSAEKKDAVFFLHAGDGRNFVMSDMEGEDLMGWLVPGYLADQFEQEWIDGHSESALEKWAEFFCWAEWEEAEEGITVKFTDTE